MKLTGKTEVLWVKPVVVPLFPTQIPQGLTRDRARTSAVRGRRLTA
jgi:cytochrome c-type biogenesis protein CcmH/NrfF